MVFIDEGLAGEAKSKSLAVVSRLAIDEGMGEVVMAKSTTQALLNAAYAEQSATACGSPGPDRDHVVEFADCGNVDAAIIACEGVRTFVSHG
jgi:hypothetical protein